MVLNSHVVSVISGVALVFSFHLPTLSGQSSSAACDQSLRPVGAELGYQWRGDRCEGTFVREVAIQPLRLVGLQCREGLLDGDVRLHSGIPAGRRGNVRAVSLDIDIAYQMDRSVEGDGRDFSWSGSIRRALGIPGDQLAIIGTLAGVRPMFTPITAADRRGCPIEAVLQTTAGLDDVALGVYFENEHEPVRAVSSLRSPPYSLRKPIRYPLPALGRPGAYRIEGYTVRASVDRRGELDRVSYSVWFLWDGGE